MNYFIACITSRILHIKMQQDKKNYESFGSKVYWKYNALLTNYEITEVKDIWYEKGRCYSIEQYIKKFVECVKEKVIRKFPDLHKIEIKYGAFDKNNSFHRFVINAAKLITKKNKNKNYYKSIIIEIEYQGINVFFGSLNFDGYI